jgi:putative thioredoxin
MQIETSDDALIGGLNDNDGELVFDVGTHDFEDRVLKLSMKSPVIVDFWADWCEPCKQLLPVVEQVVRESKKKIYLAKVNVDKNPELAQAMRVQSVPAVFAFFGGQPISGFMGVKTLSEINAFLDEVFKVVREAQPDALDIPEALKNAAAYLADNDIANAQAVYVQILQEDENNTEAYLGLIRTFLAADDIESAEHVLEDVPEKVSKDPAFKSAHAAIEMHKSKPQGDDKKLQESLLSDPDNHQARFDLSLLLFSSGKKEEAIEALIEIIRRDREWEEEKARKKLLEFFDVMGFSDPASIEGRKKLSSVLFS